MIGPRAGTADLEIRTAIEADLPEVLSLYAEAGMSGRKMNGRKGLTLAAAREVLGRMTSYPSYAVYVAVRGGAVVATFALLIMDNLAHAGAPSAIVENVCVTERWRGRGIGKTLMMFAMEIARGKGCYKLGLSSNASREQAHAFYRSLGFELHGLSFVVRF